MELLQEFTNRMKEMLGEDYEAFAAALDLPAYTALRLNRRKIDPSDYAQMGMIFTGCDDPDEVIHWPGAYYYTGDGPGKSPFHEAGAYYIQEPSAMLPATILDIPDMKEGSSDDIPLKVLDLCAAPGGKTTQIADLMNTKGLLVANEIIPSRAKILSENVERMGMTNALVINEDPVRLADRFPHFFDRILVDAPCSGEGMFRKNPEAVRQWSPENVQMCADRQDMILDCAAKMLSYGGKLVYSTCTFSPEENEGAVDRFLDRHPDFEICDSPRRLYPHTFKGEGHFAVSFTHRDVESLSFCGWPQGCHKASSAGARALPSSRGLSERLAPCRTGPTGKLRDSAYGKRPKSVDDSLLRSFLDETLHDSCDIRRAAESRPERLVTFGDSLYLAPEYFSDIDIKGLKILRAGLKLGTFMKNRFEPDHALSHALKCTDAKQCLDFDPASGEIKQYLTGMTIPCDKDLRGWCLICVGGFPLGWAKASGGTLKNHYPKGLRLQVSERSSE